MDAFVNACVQGLTNLQGFGAAVLKDLEEVTQEIVGSGTDSEEKSQKEGATTQKEGQFLKVENRKPKSPIKANLVAFIQKCKYYNGTNRVFWNLFC